MKKRILNTGLLKADREVQLALFHRMSEKQQAKVRDIISNVPYGRSLYETLQKHERWAYNDMFAPNALRLGERIAVVVKDDIDRAPEEPPVKVTIVDIQPMRIDWGKYSKNKSLPPVTIRLGKPSDELFFLNESLIEALAPVNDPLADTIEEILANCPDFFIEFDFDEEFNMLIAD